MTKRAKADEPAEAASLQPWERNRQLRLAQIEAEQAHGEQLAARYGYGPPRQRFAIVGHGRTKRRRRR